MNTKHKPNKTTLINEKLGPKIIEIGKTENNINGMFAFMSSVFFIYVFYILFLIFCKH